MPDIKGFRKILFYRDNTWMEKRITIFFLINFYPEGELEAPICCVIQGLQ